MLDLSKTVLILTGCIAPESNINSLVIADAKVRLRQYEEAISWFIEKSLFENIIFCDNSGYPAKSGYIKQAEKRKKKLEWITFEGNRQCVRNQGKGYGEGEIVAYILEHSELMRSMQYICKVTGRLKVMNINRFVRQVSMDDIYFITTGINRKRQVVRAIDTRFYGMPKTIYEQDFKEIYRKTNDDKGEILEKVFYERYAETDRTASGCFWFPMFRGISGSMEIVYHEPFWKILIKSALCLKGRYVPCKDRGKSVILKFEVENGKKQ